MVGQPINGKVYYKVSSVRYDHAGVHRNYAHQGKPSLILNEYGYRFQRKTENVSHFRCVKEKSAREVRNILMFT